MKRNKPKFKQCWDFDLHKNVFEKLKTVQYNSAYYFSPIFKDLIHFHLN